MHIHFRTDDVEEQETEMKDTHPIKEGTLEEMNRYLTKEGFEDLPVEWYSRVLKILHAIFQDEFLARRLVISGGLPIGRVYSESEFQRLSYDIDPLYRHMDATKDWGEVWDEIDHHLKVQLFFHLEYKMVLKIN